MSTTTANLLLIKMEQGEYVNSWGDIVNTNYDRIDLAIGALQTLTLDAAGGLGTIDARLDLMDHPSTGSVTNLAKMLVLDQNYYAFADRTYYGPSDATSGMGQAGRNVGALGREMDELRCSNVSRDWHVAGAHGANVATTASINSRTSGALGLMLSKSSGSGPLNGGNGHPSHQTGWVSFPTPAAGGGTVTVGNNTMDRDVIISCRGRLGVIRSGQQSQRVVTLAAASADTIYHLVATDVGDHTDAIWDQTDGTISSGTPSRLTSGLMDGKEAAKGDILRIGAQSLPTNNVFIGDYVISDIQGGHVDIEGEFQNIDSTHTGVNFTFVRKKHVTLAFQHQTTGGLAPSMLFQGADAFNSVSGAFEGTVLATFRTDAGSQLISLDALSGGKNEMHFGDRYDSGFVLMSAYFHPGGGSFAAGDKVWKRLPFPDFPSSLEIWIAEDVHGKNAAKINTYWNPTGPTVHGIAATMCNDVVGGVTHIRTLLAVQALDTTSTHLASGTMISAATVWTRWVRVIARR